MPITNRYEFPREVNVLGSSYSATFLYYDKGSSSKSMLVKLLKDYRRAFQTDGYAQYRICEEKRSVF